MNVASRFSNLSTSRSNVLNRGRECSFLTLPFILPQDSMTESSRMAVPNNNVGARCVNNLANKLLLTLFPTSTPFFKLQVSESLIQEMEENGENSVELEIEQKLSSLEHIIQSDIESAGMRPVFYEALRHQIITGNYLLYIPAKGEITGYALDKYVVRRAHNGTVLEIILEELVAYEELQDSWKEVADIDDTCLENNPSDPTGLTKSVKVYTRVVLEDNKYKECKYIGEHELPDSKGTYPKDSSAWVPLRWTGLSGEDYGRSYVEEYLGSFRSLEAYTISFKKHSAIASKIFGMIRPGSRLKPMDLARVPSGGFVYGEEDDLTFPEVGKYNDMKSVQESMTGLTTDLTQAFLVQQVRDSERTTATELRLQATELETSLGGGYSLQAKTFQQPFLQRQIYRLQKEGKLPKFKNADIEPKIVVGLDGLGRGTDLDKLMRASAALVEIAQGAQFIPGLDMTGVTTFAFNAVGLDKDGLIKTEEQMQQEQQAAQAEQQQQQGADIMKSAMSGVGNTVAKGAIENPEQTADAIENIQQ